MGNYCVLSDVNLRLNGFANLTIDANSNPDDDAVNTLIADAEAELNSALRQAGFEALPVVLGTDVAFLRSKVSLYVAAQTWMIAFGSIDVPAIFANAYDNWQAFIMQVRNKEIGLYDDKVNPFKSSKTLLRFSLESGIINDDPEQLPPVE